MSYYVSADDYKEFIDLTGHSSKPSDDYIVTPSGENGGYIGEGAIVVPIESSGGGGIVQPTEASIIISPTGQPIIVEGFRGGGRREPFRYYVKNW